MPTECTYVMTANAYVLCARHALAWRDGGNTVAMREATSDEIAFAFGCADCAEEV